MAPLEGKKYHVDQFHYKISSTTLKIFLKKKKKQAIKIKVQKMSFQVWTHFYHTPIEMPLLLLPQ